LPAPQAQPSAPGPPAATDREPDVAPTADSGITPHLAGRTVSGEGGGGFEGRMNAQAAGMNKRNAREA